MALESFWTFYNPAGDCTADESAGVLSITVPSGSTHDLWSTNNNGPRIHQPANNVDFTVETKLVSNPTTATGSRGASILAQQDNSNYVRFGVHHDGTNYKIVAAYLDNGTTATTVYNTTLTAPTYPLWLRLVRSGNNWSTYRSYDGTNFTQQGTTFSKTITINNVGLAAMNASSNPSWTQTFDYFMADGISNLQTGDHIEAGILNGYFSANAIYALSRSEALSLSSMFSAEVLAAVPSAGTRNDNMIIRDSFSANVTRADQQAWATTTRNTQTWTDQ